KWSRWRPPSRRPGRWGRRCRAVGSRCSAWRGRSTMPGRSEPGSHEPDGRAGQSGPCAAPRYGYGRVSRGKSRGGRSRRPAGSRGSREGGGADAPRVRGGVERGAEPTPRGFAGESRGGRSRRPAGSRGSREGGGADGPRVRGGVEKGGEAPSPTETGGGGA